jgi:hypothetical protein
MQETAQYFETRFFIALSKLFALHRNYEILSHSLVPTQLGPCTWWLLILQETLWCFKLHVFNPGLKLSTQRDSHALQMKGR